MHLHRVRGHRPIDAELQNPVGHRERGRAAPHGQEGPPRDFPQQFPRHKELPEGRGSGRVSVRYAFSHIAAAGNVVRLGRI